jgi:hypothetical protein
LHQQFGDRCSGEVLVNQILSFLWFGHFSQNLIKQEASSSRASNSVSVHLHQYGQRSRRVGAYHCSGFTSRIFVEEARELLGVGNDELLTSLILVGFFHVFSPLSFFGFCGYKTNV